MQAKILAVAIAATIGMAAPASASQPVCVQRGVDVVRYMPSHLSSAYKACAPAMAARLTRAGIRVTPDRTRALFAMAVAHRYAPYGRSTVSSFDALRREAVLDCDNYVALTYQIYARIGGDRRLVRFMGWDGGAVGNHAQLWIGRLLLDPTVGIAAYAPLAQVEHGTPEQRIIDLSMADWVPGYQARVITAIRGGQYRVVDVLYDVRSFAQMRRIMAGDRLLLRR